MSMIRRGLFASAIVASAVVVLLAGMDSQAQEKKAPIFKTPQAAFEGAKKLAEKGDMKAVVAILSNDNQDAMAGLMVIIGAFTKEFGAAFAKSDEDKAKVKKMADTLEKYGVTAEMTKAAMTLAGELKGKEPTESLPALRKIIQPIKDRPGLIADVMALTDKKDDGNPLDEIKTAKLKDVKVDGDSAKGMVTIIKGGEEKTEPIEFRKEGGGWKIHMDLNKKDKK